MNILRLLSIIAFAFERSYKMNISSQCMRSAWIVFMMVVMIAVLNIFLLAHNKLSTIMSFRTNDSVFTILLMGAVFFPLDLYDGVNGSSG